MNKRGSHKLLHVTCTRTDLSELKIDYFLFITLTNNVLLIEK